MSRKEKVKEIFASHGIYLSDDDVENLGAAMQETLETIADDIEEKEPYATVTISRIRQAAGDVYTELNED